MALRIVNDPDEDFATLGDMLRKKQTFEEMYPGDYSGTAQLPPAVDPIGEHALRNAPMHQQGMGQRYEDIVPFTGNNFIGNLFNPSGSDAKLAYAERAQQFNDKKDDAARRDAITELNIMKSIEATPPGKRDPQIKILQKFYQQRGKPFDPDIQKFYKTADEMGFKASKWAAAQLQQQNPTLKEDELWQALNTDPALQVEWFGEMAKYQEQQGKAESKAIENKLYKQAMERLQKFDTEAPSSPVEPSQPQAAPSPMPTMQVAPQAQQKPLQPVLADRNNNPLNIKAGPATMKWVQNGSAEVASPAQDGGYFLKFKTPDLGFQAAEDLLSQPSYAQLPLDTAMKRWSGSGYGADVAPDIPPTTLVSQLNPTQRQTLIQSMAKREGFTGQGSEERRAHIPAQQQTVLTALEQSIAKDEQELAVLAEVSMLPGFDKRHDNVAKRIEIKRERLRDMEKKYGLKFESDFEGWVAAEKKVNPSQVPAPILKQWKAEFDAAKINLSAEKASAESAATLGDRKELAQLGNAANIPGPDTILKLRNVSGEGPLRPRAGANWTEIAKENADYEAKTGRQKYVMEKPLEVKQEDDMNAKLSGVESAQRVMKYLSDPNVVKLVGTFLSNPEAGFDKAIADTFGGVVPEEYREAAAEIANLTSNILNTLIGSAQTATEFKRLQPLIGSLGAVDGKTLKAQMTVLHNSMAIDFNRRYKGLVGRGYETLPDWKEVPLLETALDRKTKEEVEATKPPEPTDSGKAMNPIKQAIEDEKKRRQGRR